MSYTVKEKKAKKKTVYIVLNAQGHRCSGIDHVKKAEAEIHCRNLNAYFGDSR